MEKKDKSLSLNESSLLLQLPNSMLSFSELSTSPVLMPVAVDTNDGVLSCASSVSSGLDNAELSSKSSASFSKPLCQLEQPLLMRKTPQKFPSQLPPTSSALRALFPLVDEPLEISVPPVVESYPEPPHPDRTSSNNFSTVPTSTSIGSINCEWDNSMHYQASAETSTSTRSSDVPVPDSDSKFFQMIPNSFPSDEFQNIIQSDTNFYYIPVHPHWLFKDTIESKEIWYGFSELDSQRLEIASQADTDAVVPTDGGRYDVYLNTRTKKSVYFDTKDLHVRRCTWFFENGSSLRCKPYSEETARMLEQHYCNCVNSGQWQRRFNIPGTGSFVFESAEVMLHYKNELEVWPSLPDSKASPKVVKRGLPDGFEIMPNESPRIDNLVFIVQGIGSFCDLRFRTVSQCVDGFRDIANKLIGSHFKNEVDQERVGRVEFLPVAWHAKLHTSDVGLDRKMQSITLPSIPKLRHFTNDTLLDILLYSSPSYCQSIIDTVACELNKLYELFLNRNPGFQGKVFVAGHSLGSLILFDILANQKTSESEVPDQIKDSFDNGNIKQRTVDKESETKPVCSNIFQTYENVESLLQTLDLDDYVEAFQTARISIEELIGMNDDDLKNVGLPVAVRMKILCFISSKQDLAKAAEALSDLTVISSKQNQRVEWDIVNTDEKDSLIYPAQSLTSGMSLIVYPRLQFQPAGFFALGSPISMFLAVRGYDTISEDFEFPTCPAFFHIFHPYDPVAFRIEPLIDPSFSSKPVLIPHHKGRKRMHLEIRENVTKIAGEIKQKLMDTMRFTWNSLSEFAKNHSFPSAILEAEVDKLVEQEMSESVETQEASSEDIQIGRLNSGRRIDYVLQEKPIEALNDYVFALTSHATYWDSEDTVLMILREIYAMEGIVISTQQIEHKPSSQFRYPSEDHATFESIASINQPDNVVSSQPSFDSNQAFYKPSEASAALVPSSNGNVQPIISNNAIPCAVNSVSSSAVPGSKHIGPPPLSGFVKRSPFMR